MNLKKIEPNQTLNGEVTLLGDKSLAHRAMLFGALANGVTEVTNFPNSGVIRTLKDCLRALGVHVSMRSNKLKVIGNNLEPFKNQGVICNCKNSATTMRLLIGALLGTKSKAIVVGSESLTKRPIRVDELFLKLGYSNFKTDSGHLPAIVEDFPEDISEIKEISTGYPSAQVKSALILASLGKRKKKIVIKEPISTRDHTENMLKSMGARIKTSGNDIIVKPLWQSLKPLYGSLPGDISSAAFVLVAAAIIPGSNVVVHDVLLNPGRIGYLEALKSAGCKVVIKKTRTSFGEDVGDISLESPEQLNAIKIDDPLQVVSMIDEFPAIATLMAVANGKSVVRNAKELRYKESDRIASILKAYQSLGLSFQEYDDGFEVLGAKDSLQKAIIQTNRDHRIAMAFALLGLVSDVEIDDENIINESFPNFKETIEGLIR